MPRELSLTPGGLRGGGAVQRYRAGVSPVDLQWTMRLKNFGTLEHYLQELAAVTALTEVSPSGRSRIHTAATLSCSPTTLLVPLVFLAKIFVFLEASFTGPSDSHCLDSDSGCSTAASQCTCPSLAIGGRGCHFLQLFCL